MKRTPLLRTKPMARSSFKPSTPKEPKPPKGPKQKKCANRACRHPYTPDPRTPFKNWCSDDCGTVLALEKLAKQKAAKARSERVEDKRRKEEGMRHQDRLELVQKLINRCAVLRDWHDGCISCDKGENWQGGVWHGSHYKSVGSNSALRFNLLNIHKCCNQCNWHKAGNIAEYEPRLAIKIGSERLEWIKSHPRSREYSTEYLVRLAAVARKWIKRRERRLGLK